MRDRFAGDVVASGRADQTLPVPLGGMVPARRRTPAWLRRWRRHQAGALTLLALAAAGGGVCLSVMPRAHVVSMESGLVRVDDVMLTQLAPTPASGLRVFIGAATLALTAPGPQTVRAGAVMTWNGHTTTGRCVVDVARHATGETCVFSIGATRLSAVDSFDSTASTWHRHYSDGVDIAIGVPRGTTLIPIPFPVGH